MSSSRITTWIATESGKGPSMKCMALLRAEGSTTTSPASAVTGAFLLARRQAIKDHEPFWSPPTRRVTQALVPPLLAGFSLGLFLLLSNRGVELAVSLIWILFYGCALHAAGFFMPRGIKWFGWLFIFSSCGLFYVFMLHWADFEVNPHELMGFFFGILHLTYGAYLYLTESGKNAA